MIWRTTNVTLPGWLEDSGLPGDLNDLNGFEHFAQDVSLDIEADNQVALQRVSADGTWETFETVSEPASQIMVTNRPAIRFVPVNGCQFRLRWKQ